MNPPVRIPRAQHGISRKQISPGTLKVLYTLVEAGFEAYLVGGGVRDLLANLKPKDFDIATSAHPEQVKKVFARQCRLIGRRFLIAHVRAGGEIAEVATFRGPITDSHERDETGRILSDNIYGSLETDAFRRDFTVNALYYDIRDYSIIDFADGISDLQRRRLRMIGEPELRYREDPVRMLRAIRVANKLGFEIEPATAEPISRLAPLLGEIPPARLFDEIIKMLLSREARANLDGMRERGLFGILFADTETALAEDARWLRLLHQAAANTAARVENDQPVTPAFLYAALLWPSVALRAQFLACNEGYAPMLALSQAADEVLARQSLRVSIPRRFSTPIREIWLLQPRFDHRHGARAKRLLAHPRFRAAYDFLVLRGASAEPQLAGLADWWTQAQTAKELPPAPADDAAASAPVPKRRSRRRGGRRRRGKKAQD
ncbi:MAG: polynucleotide adenylyltransferase PcnB [Gammaproteobacteria bacterium]|nr:polynucleotide adenylyltransferase PcnB [Gammaproteobacteria bacterium]